MSYLPIASGLARDGVAHTAQSALPNAPVVPDPEPSTSSTRTTRARLQLARALRRTADTIEPETPVCEAR
jgi:hypothetical protein